MSKQTDDPGSWIGRLFGWCLLLLLAAIALNGAVQIVSRIWLQLCIGATALLALAVVVLWWRRF